MEELIQELEKISNKSQQTSQLNQLFLINMKSKIPANPYILNIFKN